MSKITEKELINESYKGNNSSKTKEIEHSPEKHLKSEENIISEQLQGTLKGNTAKTELINFKNNIFATKGLTSTINDIHVKTKSEETFNSNEYRGMCKIGADIISKGRILILNVIKGTLIPRKTLLKINPAGISGSKRNAYDGVTFFGTNISNVFLF